MKRCQSFRIRSWVDLPHVCETLPRLAFHFQDYQNCFHLLPTTSLNFGSAIFLIPGTFHPKRRPPSSPCRRALKDFALNSNPLNLTLAGKAKVCPRQNVLSSPLSANFISKAFPNI